MALWANGFFGYTDYVFFYLMFLMDVLLQFKKQVSKAMCVLLFNTFNG